MYKVMIVDDEKIICQGVSSKIRRIDHPLIDEVIESTNPTDALIKIADLKPDIVITDMEMPDMTGLELVSKVMDTATQPKFIILSGHDDYHYVRNSFQLGVVDYILKPVTIDELEDKLLQAIQLIESEQDTINPLDDKISFSINTLAFSNDTAKINESHDYLRSILDYDNYQLICICMPSSYQVSDINDIAKELIKKLENKVSIKTIQYYDNYRNCIILLNYNDANVSAIIQTNLKDFLNELKKKGDYEANIALTSSINALFDYKYLYDEMHDILKVKIQYRPYELMLKSEYKENKTFSEAVISQLIMWFSAKDFKRITGFIDDYFKLRIIDANNYIPPSKIYIIVLQKINELFSTNDLYQKELFTRSFESFDSYMEIRIYLKNSLQNIQQFISEKDAASVSAIEMATAYIDAHLDEPLSMTQVSNHLSLNYSYFSKLFKEKIGISFKKYLIDKRMEKAKVLLQNPTNKVYEIAQQTGYDNAQNFSRAFKSHFGYSPKEYRTKQE